MRGVCWHWVAVVCLLAVGGPAAAQVPPAAPAGPADILLPARPAPYVIPPAGPYRIPEDLGPDPLLDRPVGPPPGPFFDAELQLLGVHLRNQLRGVVAVGNRVDVFDENTVPGSPLRATVSPRFEAGYRLPEGNGEVGLAYRFLTTSGSGVAVTPLGTADQSGRLNLNTFDLTYGQREYALGPFPGYGWVFRWGVGVRLLEVDFDNNLRYRVGPGAGADAVTGQRTSNNFTGAGPVASLLLERRLSEVRQGLSFGVRVEGADSFGRINQRFYETLAGPPGGGRPVGAVAPAKFAVGPLYLNGRVGFTYAPPGTSARFYLGYQYESWFEIGRLNDSRAQLNTSGAVLRVEYDY